MGAVVLLSSHILSEAEALADRITIIRDGAAVQTGTLEQLQAQVRTTVTASLLRSPGELRFLHDVVLDGGQLSATVERAQLNEAMAELSQYGITQLSVVPPSLEHLFLRHYDESAS